MIEELLPPGAATAEVFGDEPDAPLFEAEQALLAGAARRRRREFATGRHCARRALAGLGRQHGALLTGEGGAPRWPPGVVGSLTHCAGYCGAAVALETVLVGIGIDAEPHAPLPDGVRELVATDDERVHLDRLATGNGAVCWDRLMFSAKESVYKACFPLTGRWLEFHDCTVTLESRTGGFRASVRDPGAGPAEFQGRWRLANGLLLTAVTVPAPVPMRRG